MDVDSGMNGQSNVTLDRQKLLAKLDHSLRSPLNSIFHHTELLLMGLEGDLGDVVRADIQTISDEAHALNGVVQQLLLWMELAAAGLTREHINFARPIRAAIRDLQAVIDRAGKQIISDVIDQDIQILADEKAIYQIVTGLLVHVIETSESPGIKITLQAENQLASLKVSTDQATSAASPKPEFASRVITDLLLSSLLVEQMGGQLSSEASGSSYAIGLVFPHAAKAADSIP